MVSVQVTAGIKDEVEKSHKALDAIVSLKKDCYWLSLFTLE